MRTASLSLILLVCCHLTPAAEDALVPVEEVLAVVDQTPVLASDLRLAEIVELLPRAGDEAPADFASRLLTARIELEIQYRDLEDSGLLHRLHPDLGSALEALTAAAGGPQALADELARAGLGEADLESLGLRMAAVNAYVEQRLRPRVAVTLEEVEEAYHGELADQLEAAGQELPPLGAVADQIHRLLSERKLNEEISGWLGEARERQQVTRFVP